MGMLVDFDPIDAVKRAAEVCGLDMDGWIHEGDLFGIMLTDEIIWNPLVDTESAMALLFIMNGNVDTDCNGGVSASSNGITVHHDHILDYTTGIRAAIVKLAVEYAKNNMHRMH